VLGITLWLAVAFAVNLGCAKLMDTGTEHCDDGPVHCEVPTGVGPPGSAWR
jgi:hypothetical protein